MFCFYLISYSYQIFSSCHTLCFPWLPSRLSRVQTPWSIYQYCFLYLVMLFFMSSLFLFVHLLLKRPLLTFFLIVFSLFLFLLFLLLTPLLFLVPLFLLLSLLVHTEFVLLPHIFKNTIVPFLLPFLLLLILYHMFLATTNCLLPTNLLFMPFPPTSNQPHIPR